MKETTKCPICRGQVLKISDKMGKTIICNRKECTWTGEKILDKAKNNDKKNRKF